MNNYPHVALLAVLGCLCLLLPRAGAAAAPRAYSADGFHVNGKPRMLLIGTLAYFRLDPSDWDKWLQTFADSGFNMVDCIVPWNFHEPTEGKFDFSTPRRDLPRFLSLCQKHHLSVFLRSGPYICDEWDGGGFPAWLVPKPGIAPRQNDPATLAYVRKWTQALDKVIAPYQSTRGGPIILDQIENELDYFPCKDPRGYIGALRDDALADGIDIPLTVCVGYRGIPIAKATGDADGVLPTGNFYLNDNIEAAGTRFIDLLKGEHFAGGASMADIPPICSETGRDQNTLRRLLASGLKGIAPFDFAGGSNFMDGNGDNNWAKPISYLSTSIDFGGMIGFDGARKPNWFTARRLAGFVNTLSDALCRARADTNWEGGFSVSNSALGAQESPDRSHRLYRLAVPDSSEQFLFLWNGTDQAQPTQVTVGDLTFPQKIAWSVPASYDQIVPVNVPLDPWGLPKTTLRYATAEIFQIAQSGATTEIWLVGDAGQPGELCLQSAGPLAHISGNGSDVNSAQTPAGWVLTYGPQVSRIDADLGKSHLRIHLATRQAMDTPPPLPAISPIDLLHGAVWQNLPGEAMDTGGADTIHRQDQGEGPPAMESLGLLQGAAWYRADFDWNAAALPKTLSFAHAGDIVSVSLNGHDLGTQNATGAQTDFDTQGSLTSGRNTLVVRVEIWGHSNFEHEPTPSLNLNSPRGLWGPVRLDDTLLTPDWTIQPVRSDPASWAAKMPEQTAAWGAPGEMRRLIRRFSVSATQWKDGLVLHLDGTNLLGHLWVNGHALGRCFFGPATAPKLVGGPSNRFYIPAAWLSPRGGENLLQLATLATSADGALTTVELEPPGAPK